MSEECNLSMKKWNFCEQSYREGTQRGTQHYTCIVTCNKSTRFMARGCENDFLDAFVELSTLFFLSLEEISSTNICSKTRIEIELFYSIYLYLNVFTFIIFRFSVQFDFVDTLCILANFLSPCFTYRTK